MYLWNKGRDGCVDVGLATYYLGPQLARRTVLLEVRAQSRQFAVWSEDQIARQLPIKGLVGQEMALDDYLQSIKQEALAARAGFRHVRPGKSDSLRCGTKEPDGLLCPPACSNAGLI